VRKINHEVYDYVTYHKNISVADLSHSFNISERTARRILNQLETDGLICRYHGGAHVLKDLELSDELSKREKQKNIIKMNIARVAASYVNTNDVIIMLGGTTVLAMCEFLISKRITVITNSLAVAAKLAKFGHIKLILLGGALNMPEMETQGLFTYSLPAALHVNSMFVGASSFSIAQGITTNDQTLVKQYSTASRIAEHVYALFDSSKFIETRYFSAIHPKDITAVITNKIDEKTRRQLRTMDTKVLIAAGNYEMQSEVIS